MLGLLTVTFSTLQSVAIALAAVNVAVLAASLIFLLVARRSSKKAASAAHTVQTAQNVQNARSAQNSQNAQNAPNKTDMVPPSSK